MLEYDDVERSLSCTAVYAHPAEVWRLAPCPSREDLVLTLHSTDDGAGRQASVWKLPSADASVASAGALQAIESVASMPAASRISRHVESVLWSPEERAGSLSLATTQQECLSVWSLGEGEAQCTTKGCAAAAITAACWDPHSSERLFSCSGGALHSWDLRAAAGGGGGGGIAPSVVAARAHNGAVTAVDCNPNKAHQALTAGVDGLIKCWDVRKSAEPLLTLQGHSHWVWGACYNPSHDQLLLSASSDHTVRLWGASSISSEPLAANDDDESSSDSSPIPREVEQNDGGLECFGSHMDSVYSVAWSAADAFVLASVSYDGQLAVNHVCAQEKSRILL